MSASVPAAGMAFAGSGTWFHASCKSHAYGVSAVTLTVGWSGPTVYTGVLYCVVLIHVPYWPTWRRRSLTSAVEFADNGAFVASGAVQTESAANGVAAACDDETTVNAAKPAAASTITPRLSARHPALLTNIRVLREQ